MIKVMIDRHCQSGKENELKHLLIELRMEALQRHGYVSGETLREVDDPLNFIVISMWTTLEYWKAWDTARQRLAIEEMIDTLLIAPRQVRVLREDYED
jgi:heme-degrading monooxygenase HmoA